MDSSNLPIDIQCSKILNWILDRRHCPREWQKEVMKIRTKINLAIQDMPEHPSITELLSGSTIHYFNCLSIIKILHETEKETRNIFGMYSSQRIKDWNNVVSLYQKNNIYLGEAASLLQRNVSYEIPSLKKQVHKLQQMQDECDKKYQSATKSINEINHQLKQSYEELGIKGENLAAELKSIPNSLESVYNIITTKCEKLSNFANYYSKYVEYFFKRNPSEALPYLSYLIKNGNKTVFEWRTGIKPTSIERPACNYDFGEEDKQEVVSTDADEINFDLNDVVLDETGDIDWGDTENIEAVDVSEAHVANGDEDAFKGYIIVEDAGVYVPSDGIAKGNDALTLLEFIDTRNLIFQDLTRLNTFLNQKYLEMSEEQNVLISTIMQDAPKEVQAFTENDIRHGKELVSDIINYFTSKKTEKLFLIHDSSKYLKRIYEQLTKKVKSISRYNRNKEEYMRQKEEFKVEENATDKNHKLLIKKTKELQKSISEDLSKKCNCRRVNIMGEINTW